MRPSLSATRIWTVALCSAAALAFSASAFADPPERVARLTQIAGTVSFSPAGEEDWAIAEPNRPVTTGDRIWSDAGSHTELQIGSAAARLGANTSVALLNLDDRIAQFQLAQGTLNVRVRQISGDQFYEIDTPNLAFSIKRAGDYRVDVDPSGNTTVIQVRSGQGEAWGEGTAYVIDAGQQYTFAGEGMRDYRYDPLPQPDEFDRWCFDRNRREEAAVAARYVSPDVIGYSDLDEYGSWRNVESYGTVWVPTRVATDWVPYHYGRWGWVEPWGWTWIDDSPWGFAPFHYGRWAYLSSHWCWVPGPRAVRAVYAPALVAFVGGGGFSLSIGGGPVGGIAWFPLGVGEVYRPSYAVSRTYFTQINVTNTVINNTYVTNVYNNPNVNVTYRNREIAGAVTAVPTNAFASGERVDRHAVAVPHDVVAREHVSNVAAVTPSHAAVIAAGAAIAGGAAVAAAHRPPAAVLNRQVVARTAPPAHTPSFAARASLLSSQPGRPLEAEKMKALRSERAAEAPKIKVVSPTVTPRALDKGAGKGGGAVPGGQAQEERAYKERKGGPQTSAVPQPPAATQERMREFKGGSAQGGQAPGEERAMKERKGGPQAGVPQQPAAAQERFKGPPPGAQGGPPPGGQAQEQERAMKERRGGGAPPGAGGPPPQAQERFKGPPPGAQGGPPPGGQAQEQERAMKERRGGGAPPGAGGPPPQAQERFKGPPGAQGGPPPGGQAQQQERALKERRSAGPPPGSPQGAPQGPQGAPQAQRGPPPAPPGAPQGGRSQERREEPKGKAQNQEKDKDKDKEHRGQ
ncbi:MAG TPA: DUF6600 domain-containing protein [Casimicrobiaceae bacterium]|nr:DUF6600 domain-containing protein [Casimicrobiaceae bacterium]